MSDFKNRQSAEILKSVYKNADMAYEASGDVLRHCTNNRLRSEISQQRDRYKQVKDQTRTEIIKCGGTPSEYPPYTKMMSKMGINMKTMNNSSGKNIASLMIRGTTMGIIDMQHAVNCSQGAQSEIKNDAEQLLRREQDFCEHLKKYL